MDFQIVPVAEASVETLMKSIDRVIINPIIFFLFAVAMVYFLYGLTQYFLSPANEEIRKKAKTHMIWGIVGLFIMVGVFGIMKIIIGTLGVTNVKINSNGDYVVGDKSILAGDKTVTDSTKSNQNLFTGPLDVSSQNTPDYPPGTFTENPFPTYKQNAMCWQRSIYDTANTEYDAFKLIKNEARTQYLHDNGISATDKNYLGYPTTFESNVLYDKKAKLYYAWIDTRAPIKGGTDKDCDLEIIAPARVLPDPTISIDIRYGADQSITNVPKPKITSYTTDPFPQDYIEHPDVCWHSRPDVMATGSTEYIALQSIKTIARKRYLDENHLTDSTADPKLPTVYGVLSAYDATHKLYYVWWDVRAPIGAGKTSDCNLLEQIDNSTRSIKPDPLISNYISDSQFYRVVDSGVDTTYIGARSKAINNALLQLAALKGINNISSIVYRVLPEEKYYPPDPANNYYKYDYWLALESPK